MKYSRVKAIAKFDNKAEDQKIECTSIAGGERA